MCIYSLFGSFMVTRWEPVSSVYSVSGHSGTPLLGLDKLHLCIASLFNHSAYSNTTTAMACNIC